MATAVSDTAAGPRKRFSTSVATEELVGMLAISSGRQRVVVGGIHEQIHARHEQRAADEGARQISLRVADLAREGRDIVPAVIGPQRAEHGGAEAGDAAARARRDALAGTRQSRAAEMRQAPGANTKAPMPTPSTSAILAIVTDERRAAAGRHRRAIDERHGPDRRQSATRVRPLMPAGTPGRAAARCQLSKAPPSATFMNIARPTASAACDPGAKHGEGHPAEQKPDEAAVRAAQIHIVAARLRHHAGDLRIAKRAGQRQKPRGHPHQHDGFRAAHVASHDARLQEHARADHVGHVDRDRRPRPHAPRQLRAAHFCRVAAPHPWLVSAICRPTTRRIFALVFAALVVFMVYRRLRRSFGRQPLRPTRMTVRMGILLYPGGALWRRSRCAAATSCSPTPRACRAGVALALWGA